MSNLGPYKTLVTVAKNVGGPKVLAGLMIGGGAAAGAVARPSLDKALKSVRRKLKKNNGPYPPAKNCFDVIHDGVDGSGLKLHVGGKYQVLESVEERVHIAVIDDPGGPYWVTREFLGTVSEFPGPKKSDGAL